jgi:hypothetical protein
MASSKGRGNQRDNTRGTQPGGDANHKRMESRRISDHIADFERGGGRVEKLGTTRVLQKVDSTAAPDAPAPPKPPARKR